MRIDKYLFENGYAQSRQKAREIIEAGMVYVDKKQITKPSYDLDPETKEIEVTGKPYEYVSRGGVKLEGALDHFKVEVNGLVAADIGSSTGGFTDCLLRRGAKKVFALPVAVVNVFINSLSTMALRYNTPTLKAMYEKKLRAQNKEKAA